jgi:hypothetical protein
MQKKCSNQWGVQFEIVVVLSVRQRYVVSAEDGTALLVVAKLMQSARQDGRKHLNQRQFVQHGCFFDD